MLRIFKSGALVLAGVLLAVFGAAFAAGGINNGNVIGTVDGYIDGSGNFQPWAQTSAQSRDSYSITPTFVTCTSTSGQLIGSNASRKYLQYMQVGGIDATILPGTGTAIAGQGQILQNGGVGHQGSSQEFPHGAPNNAFQCVTASGTTTIEVWEGQ